MQKSKLDRRSAIGIVLAGVGFPYMARGTERSGAEVAQLKQGRSVPMSVVLDMDQYKDFTVVYNGKQQTYTVQEVMDALFGAGKFGNEVAKLDRPRIVQDYDKHYSMYAVPPDELRGSPQDVNALINWCKQERIFLMIHKKEIEYLGVPVKVVL